MLGAGAGLLLTVIADWWVTLEWAPFRGPVKVFASIAEPYATIGALAVGVAAGLVLAYLAAKESLAVAVDDERVVLNRGGVERAVSGDQVAAAFVDGKQLVLVGPAAEELAREKSDLPAARLREAFVAHGYRWEDEDPYGDQFRRWVEDMPGLPVGANALLRAREKALTNGDQDDAAQLRTELAQLGVVVREEKKRQYWRHSAV